MIKVDVIKKVKCEVDSKEVGRVVEETLGKNGVLGAAETSVTFVNAAEIQKLAEKYLGESGNTAKGHPVLSFLTGEVEGSFAMPEDGVLHLGEIIISWDWVLKESKKTGKLVNEIVGELAEHGALHLAGKHHN